MKRLGLAGLTVADVMQRDVFTVTTSETLRDAMRLMTENHVSGLPVVENHGVCVGLISGTDILNYEQEHSEESAEGNAETAPYFNIETGRWEVLRLSAFALERFGDVRVTEVMSDDLISVTPEALVQEAAATMSNAKVHRLLVLGHGSRLVGVLSASDMVDVVAGLL